MKKLFIFLLLLSACGKQEPGNKNPFSVQRLVTSTYHVGGTGANDGNPGTQASPFATIQKAASVALSGDAVVIHKGTYRETVTPANGGVTFRNFENDTVTVSGLERVTGTWTQHSGNIYRTTLSLQSENYIEEINGSNTTLLGNQIFKDGVMMIHARWPNIDKVEDYFDLTKFRQALGMIQDNGSQFWITDASIPQGLTGGWVPINGWFLPETERILSQNGSTIYIGPLINQDDEQNFRQRYYATDKLVLLDAAKEWQYENGTLYFWQAGGGPPTGVEYKKRNWGFDLQGKSNITIIGLHFIGCDAARCNTGDSGNVIDNIRSKYANHSIISTNSGSDYYGAAKQTGVQLIGTNCTVKNSEFKYAGSTSVWVGDGGRVENNLFEWIDYDGMWGNPVKVWTGNGQVITKNTSRNTGRGFLDLSNYGSGNMDISYNDWSGHNMLSNDGAGIYSQAHVKHTGTRIHHNWGHDSRAGAILYKGINVTGVYFDQGSGDNVTMDHNVFYNGPQGPETGDYYTERYSDDPIGGIKHFYNTYGSVSPTRWSVVNWNATVKDEMKGNIFRLEVSPPATNNLYAISYTVDPKFVGTGEGGLKYRLQGNSPAINIGISIPGITDGSVGLPDAGAYEYGGEDWVPGYVPVNTPTPEPPEPEIESQNVSIQ